MSSFLYKSYCAWTLLVTKNWDALTAVIGVRQRYYLRKLYVNIPLNVRKRRNRRRTVVSKLIPEVYLLDTNISYHTLALIYHNYIPKTQDALNACYWHFVYRIRFVRFTLLLITYSQDSLKWCHILSFYSYWYIIKLCLLTCYTIYHTFQSLFIIWTTGGAMHVCFN